MTEKEIRGLADALHDAAVTKGFWSVDNAKDKHLYERLLERMLGK